MWLLAQTPGDVDKGVDIIEKVSRGSVAMILLCLLVLAIVGIVWMVRRQAKLDEKRADDDEKRSARERDGYQKALSDTKADADKVRGEQLGLMRERLQAEKETDATIAGAARAIERCGTVLERVERLCERLERRLENKQG